MAHAQVGIGVGRRQRDPLLARLVVGRKDQPTPVATASTAATRPTIQGPRDVPAEVRASPSTLAPAAVASCRTEASAPDDVDATACTSPGAPGAVADTYVAARAARASRGATGQAGAASADCCARIRVGASIESVVVGSATAATACTGAVGTDESMAAASVGAGVPTALALNG